MSFYKLVTEYFSKKNSRFDIDKYIVKCHKDPEVFLLNEISVCKLLPKTKLIAEKEIDKVVVHGSECYYERKSLYKHKEYFIVMHYIIEGHEISCRLIQDNFRSLKSFYKKCFTIVHEDDFVIEDFLGPDESDLNFIAKTFANIYADIDEQHGWIEFVDYIADRYTQ